MRIKLLKGHDHAGETYKPGDTITVRDEQGERLISMGIGEASESPEPRASSMRRKTKKK